MRKNLVFIAVLLFVFSRVQQVAAQQVLQVGEVLNLATERGPTLKAGTLQTLQNRYLEKSALDLPNPALVVESPTGNFYTFGVQQSFNFPTIYDKQKKLAQQQPLLSEKNQAIAQNDLRLQVRLLYLNIQFLQEQIAFLNQLTLDAQASGKEILYPVATVILGGLVSSTLLDIIVTPVVFYAIGEKALKGYFKSKAQLDIL